MIDNGQRGYSETGKWSTSVGGFNGTNWVARTVTQAASATATWTSRACSQGRTVFTSPLRVRASTRPRLRSRRMTAAQLGHPVDQRVDPVTQSQGGREEGSYGGVGWLDLGTVSVSSVTFSVVLNNLAAATSWTPTACCWSRTTIRRQSS